MQKDTPKITDKRAVEKMEEKEEILKRLEACYHRALRQGKVRNKREFAQAAGVYPTTVYRAFLNDGKYLTQALVARCVAVFPEENHGTESTADERETIRKLVETNAELTETIGRLSRTIADLVDRMKG